MQNPAIDAVPSSPAAAGVDAPVTLRFWGTRGSIPSPGAQTARYGGNTSCLEIRAGGRRVVLDAGTGIRGLGQALARAGPVAHTPIFLTHFHWDHIQGLPFFLPLYDPGVELTILGPRQGDRDVRALFAGQMDPIHFPVPFGAVAARLSFGSMDGGCWERDGIRVTALRVKHPSNVLGYRVETQGRAVCFIPDNELEGEGYPVEPGWRDRMVAFVRDADLLVHDSMYTDEEYRDRAGWGHSTFGQAVRLAEEAGVGSLRFFHHDPRRTDDALDAIVDRIREEALGRGSTLPMDAAREGSDFTLGGS